MRTIKQLPVAQDSNVRFPQSTILNEEDTVEGTPVVREIYGDVLTNLYKLLEVTETTPTGTEDSDDSQYQIIDALRLFSNTLNDVEQVISLGGTIWSVPFNLTILPNKYVFFAIASDSYDSAINYTFKGVGSLPILPFTSVTGFNASDELIIIIDNTGVRAISLNSIASSSLSVNTSFGTPISYNNSNEMTYLESGKLIRNTPFEKDIQALIRASSGDSLALIYDMFILSSHVLCFVYLPGAVTYQFWQFNLLDLDTAISVNVTGITIPVGSDQQPYVYTDGEFIYATNRAGTVADDFEISKFVYDSATPRLTLSVNFALNAAFEKTSNVVVKEDEFFFTFINSILQRYEIATGLVTTVGDFSTINGQLFSFNGSFYYSNGEIGIQWTI